MVNKYIFRSRISEKKFREIIRLFALDIEATKIATLTGVSRRTITKIQKGTRERIAEFCEADSPFDPLSLSVYAKCSLNHFAGILKNCIRIISLSVSVNLLNNFVCFLKV